jgi:hypothetical protein
VPQDLVSFVLTPEQIAAAFDGVALIETSLPDRMSLPREDRAGMVFMGPRSEPFCRQTVRVLDQNRHIVPPSLDVDGAKADLAAIDQLRPVVERLRRLVSQLDDTLLALGSDVMVTTLEGYGQLKLSGAAHGLDDLRKEVGARWARGRRKPEAKPE